MREVQAPHRREASQAGHQHSRNTLPASEIGIRCVRQRCQRNCALPSKVMNGTYIYVLDAARRAQYALKSGTIGKRIFT